MMPFGNQLSKKDESGVLTRYTYDLNNRLKTIVDADGEAIVVDYDGVGNEISRTDRRGFETLYEYDKLDRLVKETEPEGGVKETSYDAVGNVIAFEDQRDNSFYVEYDENNRRTAVLTKEGYLTTFEYDNVGNETAINQYDLRYDLVTGATTAIPPPKSSDTPRVTRYTYNNLNQLETKEEPSGLISSYTYDEAGNLLEIMDTALPEAAAVVVAAAAVNDDAPQAAAAVSEPLARERVTYNKKNQVISREDANGVITRLVLDRKGNTLERIEDFGGEGQRSTRYTYDRLDRVKTETNPLGTRVEYEYDKSDRLTERKTLGDAFVEDRVETFKYDQQGRLDYEINGVGAKTQYAYFADGNVKAITYASDQTVANGRYTESFEYDDNGRQTAQIDGEGVRTEYEYDLRGNKIKTMQGVGSGEQARVTNYTYDDQDRLISITNPERDTTNYYYDAKGNQNIIEDANGTLTINTFDDAGRIKTNTVGKKGTITVAADGVATATIVSQSGGIKTTNTYDLRGNVTSTTVGYAADGSEQRVTSYEFDDLDQLVKIIDPEGFSSLFEYDAFGNQTSVTIGEYEPEPGDVNYIEAKALIAKPQATTFTYDDADQLIETVDSNDNAVTNAYDKHGNQISFVTGIAKLGSVDLEHRSETIYRYDADGKLLSKKTAGGGEIRIIRNVLGQETKKETLQSLGGGVWITERTEYDSFGRVTAEYDSSNVKTTYDYDAVGNLSTLTRDAGGAEARVTQFRYDANGNLLRQINPIGESSYTAFTYDALGNLLTTTDANGEVTRSFYDEYSRLVATVDAENYFTEFERDVVGNVLGTKIYANALVAAPGNMLPAAPTATSDDRFVRQTFDKNGKRTSEVAADGSIKRYAYDSVGLLLSQTETAATNTAAENRTVDLSAKVLTWSWDAVGRLIGFTNVDGVVESYTYDAAGNRLSETISNPNGLATGVDEIDSVTTYTYDLSNRVKSQSKGTFFERLVYDAAGNVVRKEDAAGVGSSTVYDTNNRVKFVTDALNQTIEYRYDRVGNLVYIKDAENNISQQEFDLNDRVIKEIGPPAIGNIDAFYSSVRPLKQDSVYGDDYAVVDNVYDAVGNLIRRVDESGFTLTRWYDGRNQMIAEVDGDSALRKYSYNAFGQVETTTTDKVRLSGTPSPTGSVPTGSSSIVQITNEFDVMGNIVRTLLPSVQTTALNGSGANTTAASPSNEVIEELSFFDAWGNLVESVDRMGNSSFNFVDDRGRQIASVDPEGYLIETFYDSQDNAIKQVKYEDPVSSTVAGTLPTAPTTGKAHAVDKSYDAEGRLASETSAEVRTYENNAGTNVRVETTYTYDIAGNVKTKTLANGTSQAQTEYYFYDAIGQRTHVVTSDGVLARFAYDKNGNLTEQSRFVNRVLVPANSLPSTPTANPGDQTKQFAYNAANLLSKETTVVAGGNIVTDYFYDASGNLTKKVEDATGDRITSEIGYDAAGRINLTITPNGGQSSVEYNVFGLKTTATTGGDPNATAPAVNNASVTTSLSNGLDPSLTVSWALAEDGTGLTSWVAWDTVSKGSAASADLAALQPNGDGIYSAGSSASTDGASAAISLEGLAAGTNVYFRVMVRDSLGNVSWSQERSIVVPTYVTQAYVKQTGPNEYVVEAEFNGSVTSPVLVGTSDLPMTQVGASSRYTATLTGVANPATYEVGFKWGEPAQATSKATLLTGETDPRDGNEGWILWTLPSADPGLLGNTQLVVFDGVTRPPEDSIRSEFGDTLQHQFPPGSTASNYDIYYGNRVSETHTMTVDFVDTQDLLIDNVVNQAPVNSGTEEDPDWSTTTNWTEQYVSDAGDTIGTSVTVTLSPSEASRVASGTNLKLAYRAVPEGNFTDPAFVIVDMTAAGDIYSSSVVELAAGSNTDLKVFYVDADGREVVVELQRIVVPAEVADGGESNQSVTIAGQSAPGVVSATPLTLTESLAAPVFAAAQSLVVFASELDGRITADGSETRAFMAGRYSGPVDASSLTTSIAPAGSSGAAGKSLPFSSQAFSKRPFYTQIIYNDLGIKIASNEEGGVWRRYGVDANGNEVATYVLGDQWGVNESGILTFTGSGSPPRELASYARFDARNLEVERIDSEGAVTTTTYDYASRIKSINDPGPGVARVYTYDGTGNLIAERDALNGNSSYYYDRLGNLIRSVDQSDDVEVFNYSYSGNTANRLISTYFEGLPDSSTVSYLYDSFGRRTSATNGSGAGAETVTVTYDQNNRVKTVVDAGATADASDNNTTEYWYDGRDNQVLVKDANGKYFGRAYNEMGFVTHEFAFIAAPGTAGNALALMDQYVGANAATKAILSSSLAVSETRYDIFSNKRLTISAGEVQRSFTYGAFARLTSAGNANYEYDAYGRQTREYISGSKDIRRGYDDAGRLLYIDDIGWGGTSGDSDSLRTDYTYDEAGNRLTEIVRSGASDIERSQTYSYDNKNQLTSWTDSAVSGVARTESYTYSSDGNLASVVNFEGTTSYGYDAADRITHVNGAQTFGYDTAGRRASEGSTNYTYQANGWLKTATADGTVYTWSYDKVGNVVSINEGDTPKKLNSTYDYAYRVTNSGIPGDQTTSTTFNRDGQVTQTRVTNDEGKTFSYNYSYDAEGREIRVSGSGGGDGAAGTSSSSYDRNGRLVSVSLGSGDDDNATTSKSFRYDNDGKIIYAYKNGDNDESGTYNYLYAIGDPVGEYQGATSVAATSKLNEGNYATLKEISAGIDDQPAAFPSSGIIQHTVAAGDTLRSIADQYYGSPDLWYVIADANGLTAKDILQVGSRLLVPNTVDNAYHTAETSPLYKEGDIVGSSLPNLKTPPPEEDECKKITAIILVVVVAIAAIALTVVTVGAAAPAAAAALGFAAGSAAAIAVSVAVGVVVGAAIAFAASALTQGILIGFGLQKEFDWEAVAADTVAGAFGGAAAGLGAAVATASKVTTLLKVSNVVGQVALETAGEAASQAIQNDGQVTNPWLVVAAGAGGALGAVGDIGKRGVKVAGEAGSVVSKGSDLGTDVSQATRKALGSVDEVASVARAAGKGKAGVFKDVFFSQLSPKSFTQSVAKGGIADLADGKKLIRTVETAKDGARTVTFKTVDKLSEAGTSKIARLQSLGNSVVDSIKTAPSKLKQSVTEFARSGRVKELDLPGNVKTVRSFVTNADGKRVEKLSVVFRQSYLGTSRTARIKGVVSDVSQAVGSKLSAAKKAVSEAPGKLTQAFTEFRRSGRVKSLDLPGNTKTVRTFETAADGTRVEKLNVVFRQSYLGTSRTARISDAAGALSDAIGSKLTAAGKALSEAPGKLKQSIYEAYKSGRVKELDLPGNVKTVRSFETAANGKRVEKLQVVFRQSYLGTSKTARFKNFVSTASTAVAEAASPVLAKGKAFISKKVGAEVAGLKNPRSAQGAKFYGGRGETALNVIENEFIPRSENEKESLYKQIGSAKFSGLVNKASFVYSSPAKQLLSPYIATVARGETYSYTDVVKSVEAAGKTEERGKTFLDANASTTFQELHNRQHNYLTLEWRAVAGNTTTSILSPFAIDRAASVESLVTSNRMVSGQVWDFDQESFVTFAEGSVGGVGGDPAKTPGSFG